MYGFNKLNSNASNLLLIDTTDSESNTNWEFKHPDFQRGDIDSLKFIKRKTNKLQFNQKSESGSMMNLIPNPGNGNGNENVDFLESRVSELEDKL